MKTVNLMKTSYKIHRQNSKKVYKGFGFSHLSDATAYYVHPQNQAMNHSTTLSQPIAEALVLFTELMQHVLLGQTNLVGTVALSEEQGQPVTSVAITMPADWRDNGVTPQVTGYRAQVRLESISIVVEQAPQASRVLFDLPELDDPSYPLLPCFLVLLAAEYCHNKDWQALFDGYLAAPSVEAFVNLHEDFYQNHKFTDYYVTYDDELQIDAQATALAVQAAVKRENKLALKQVAVQPIDHFAADHFSEEMQALIPKLAPELQLDPQLNGVVDAVVHNDARSVLLHGPAGTGKTIACKLICQQAKLPLVATINATENLDEYVLGKFLPQDDRIVFQESYVTKAIREGGAVVFEEINFAKPQYLAFLNSLLDDNGFVRLDNGVVVRRHPDFRFFATMNRGYFGTKELNQALFNRFNVVAELAELSDQSIERMLLARVPECHDFLAKILGVYHKIKTRLEKEELDAVLSPRNLENWARLAHYEGYVRAAEMTIVPIARGDQYLAQTIRDIIQLYRWSATDGE